MLRTRIKEDATILEAPRFTHVLLYFKTSAAAQAENAVPLGAIPIVKEQSTASIIKKAKGTFIQVFTPGVEREGGFMFAPEQATLIDQWCNTINALTPPRADEGRRLRTQTLGKRPGKIQSFFEKDEDEDAVQEHHPQSVAPPRPTGAAAARAAAAKYKAQRRATEAAQSLSKPQPASRQHSASVSGKGSSTSLNSQNADSFAAFEGSGAAANSESSNDTMENESVHNPVPVARDRRATKFENTDSISLASRESSSPSPYKSNDPEARKRRLTRLLFDLDLLATASPDSRALFISSPDGERTLQVRHDV